MKPENWNDMSNDEQHEDAHRLFNSIRGRLVLGQALAKAVALMKLEEYPETSNIEDMEELGEVLFQPFFSMYGPEAEEARRKAFEVFKQNT